MRGMLISAIVIATILLAIGFFSSNTIPVIDKRSISTFDSKKINESQEKRDSLWKSKYNSQGALPPKVDRISKVVFACSYDKESIFQLNKIRNRYFIQGIRAGAVNPVHPELWPCISEYGISKRAEKAWFDSLSKETRLILTPGTKSDTR